MTRHLSDIRPGYAVVSDDDRGVLGVVVRGEREIYDTDHPDRTRVLHGWFAIPERHVGAWRNGYSPEVHGVLAPTRARAAEAL